MLGRRWIVLIAMRHFGSVVDRSRVGRASLMPNALEGALRTCFPDLLEPGHLNITSLVLSAT